MKWILLIEDDLDLARELALALRKWAFEVDLIDKFENETGIDVIYDTYESNEIMYQKVKNSPGTWFNLPFRLYGRKNEKRRYVRKNRF